MRQKHLAGKDLRRFLLQLIRVCESPSVCRKSPFPPALTLPHPQQHRGSIFHRRMCRVRNNAAAARVLPLLGEAGLGRKTLPLQSLGLTAHLPRLPASSRSAFPSSASVRWGRLDGAGRQAGPPPLMNDGSHFWRCSLRSAAGSSGAERLFVCSWGGLTLGLIRIPLEC